MEVGGSARGESHRSDDVVGAPTGSHTSKTTFAPSEHPSQQLHAALGYYMIMLHYSAYARRK